MLLFSCLKVVCTRMYHYSLYDFVAMVHRQQWGLQIHFYYHLHIQYTTGLDFSIRGIQLEITKKNM
jgi:hypothetical protein